MGIDQAHEQNKLFKIDGSATDLLNNAVLLKWTVKGPGITEMVWSFFSNDDADTEIPHHQEHTNAFEKQCREDVKSMWCYESLVIRLLSQKVNYFKL